MLELEQKLEEMKAQANAKSSGRTSCPPVRQYKKLCLQENINRG